MKSKIRQTLAKLGYYTKPDFIIIGAQKSGTTGLFDILDKHSCIASSAMKEVHYFDNDEWFNNNKLFEYHSVFPLPYKLNAKSKAFEASPMYIFHPEVASRLHHYNPNLKLILSLREPAQRAFSAWTMYHHHFKTGKYSYLHDPRTFSEAITEEINGIEKESYYTNPISYVKRGIYHLQIEKYLEYFKKEQLLIFEANTLRKQPDQVLKTIQNFIDVPHEKLDFISSNSSKLNEKDKYKNDIISLQEFYKPYNEKLFNLLGERYDWNSNK